MHKVLIIAWREFRHTALTKAFIFGAVILPALITGVMALMPFLFTPNLTPLEGVLAIVDADGAFTRALETEVSPQRLDRRLKFLFDEAAEEARTAAAAPAGPSPDAAAQISAATPPLTVALSVQGAQPAELDALKDRLRRGELVGIAVCEPALLQPPQRDEQPAFSLLVPSGSPPNHTRILERSVAEAVIRARASHAGRDVDEARALVRPPEADIRRLSASGDEAAESMGAKMMIPMGFMMLLWISTFVSANYLLTTTIEEKSNKVMEVLLSAVSPMQLMTGKILGQAIVSAVMMLLYAAAAAAALTTLSLLDLIQPILILWFLIFFVMAYFMIASLMAGIGSAVNDIHEAQSLIAPMMLSLMIPLVLWLPISENPNGVLATVTSFIPPVMPFVMILRVSAASEQAPLWQVILSIIWGFTAMIGMIWMAARIFRVGVLMYGKPPSPMELLRWARYR